MRREYKRAIFRGSFSRLRSLNGEPLEDVSGYATCVALLQTGWKGWFLLGERSGWTEDEYFALAERAFREKRIEPVRQGWL